ncbi:hypothetical protein H2204_004688 [Knufia peltigerae]|uniref:Xylanolytic transcriptional activator regulatory domain-containing protein n=1 Tax=Knufia peltigerae TaxID=1002370 RepID=A0AA38Y6S4_9EURO|nr:hypothetical protein H2204_004688 [Knufia peltigerae]
MCRDRNRECVYAQRSRRVSQPAQSTSGTADGRHYSLGANNTETSDHGQEVRERGIDRTVSRRNSPWPSGADTNLYATAETRPTAAHQQESTTTMNSVANGALWDGSTIVSPSGYTDSFLQNVPGSPVEGGIPSSETGDALQRLRIEGDLPQTDEADLFADVMHLEGNDNTDRIQNDEIFAELDTSTIPEFLDILLPELPDVSFEDHTLLLAGHAGQSDCREDTQSEMALPRTDKMIHHQLRDPSFQFPSTWHDITLSSLPTASVMHNNEASNQSDLAHMPPLSWKDNIIDPDGPQTNETRKERHSKQSMLVKRLIDYAITASDVSSVERRRYWESESAQVSKVFGLSQPSDPSGCIFVRMVQLYQQNILPLWPMICEKDLQDPTSLHPVLFLVAVSIGAMYLDQRASVFGDILQKGLRTALITSFIEEELTDTDTIWLAQARNTIQVVSLYSGQGLGLTYAQHLGAVLLSQSRRMGLFRRTENEDFSAPRSAEEHVAAWVRTETRRRVAFGIFRADVFMSSLMNCPPSISPEELKISLPYPDSLWQSIGNLPAEEMLDALRDEAGKQNSGLLFCDLVRITLDRHEVLLNMEARDYELLLFGLQREVWKFSHDPDMFQRLTGHTPQEDEHADFLDVEVTRVFDNHSKPRDRLQIDHREMKDLILDRRRLLKALEKWNQSFNASRYRAGFSIDRGSILSSLLLFHIYHVQLNASLDVLHQIADGRCNKTTIDNQTLRKTIRWAHNSQGRKATYHASKIWSLLDNEARMNPMKKARYTMLSFMGLYHASVVLWTTYGAQGATLQPLTAPPSIGGLDLYHPMSEDSPGINFREIIPVEEDFLNQQ